MSPPGTFERVYAAIRDHLRQGAFRPGERLEPAALSDELNASVTPIRDALHRLAGERLIETPRHEGFRVPLITETILRHLYAWHLDLLLLATARRHLVPVNLETGEDDAVSGLASSLDRQNTLFLKLAEANGSPEHVWALRSLIERIEPYRRLEEGLLNAAQNDSEDIVKAISSGDRKALRKSLVAYRRRRARLVPELVARAQLG